MAVLAIAIPKHFPNHINLSLQTSSSILKVDFLGVFLLLAAMTLHITGLEQAANMYSWASAMVLAPIILSVIIWISFFVSQWYSTKPSVQREPLFPWRFCKNRVLVGLIA